VAWGTAAQGAAENEGMRAAHSARCRHAAAEIQGWAQRCDALGTQHRLGLAPVTPWRGQEHVAGFCAQCGRKTPGGDTHLLLSGTLLHCGELRRQPADGCALRSQLRVGSSQLRLQLCSGRLEGSQSAR
jgi:hypothetical protein